VGLQSYARAQELGIDVTLQTEYVWIGHEFSRAGVPSPWSEYSDDHGQIFYYNHETCVHSPSLSTPAHSCPCGSGGMLPLAWKWVSVGVFDANGELAGGGGGSTVATHNGCIRSSTPSRRCSKSARCGLFP
jgi:hypothetical protein